MITIYLQLAIYVCACKVVYGVLVNVFSCRSVYDFFEKGSVGE